MNLCICGLGYVGAVTAACMAKAGHTVIGVDNNEDKVRMIREGSAPVIEEGLSALMQEVTGDGRLKATTDLNMALTQSDATMVAVGTPSRANGSLDTTALERVCEGIGRGLRNSARPHTVVIRSTILPGTTRNTLIPILEESAGRRLDGNFGVCYNPEFMRESTSVKDFYTPPFTIVGHDDPHHGSVTAALYSGINAPLERTSIELSEMLKYACNAFHAAKISFANEIGVFAAKHNIDGREVMRMLCLDKKLNISTAYMKPGFAFGGSCLPKDLRALLYRAQQCDLKLPMLGSLLPSNNQQLQRGLDMVFECGKSRVGMLGLTFKNGTDDLRESPYVDLAETLIGKGYKLKIHDDNVALARLVGANAAYINQRLPHVAGLLTTVEEVINHADVLVVCTNNPLYVRAVRHARLDQEVIDFAGIPKSEEAQPKISGIAW